MKRDFFAWLEIAGLFNLAIAYPVLDLLAFNWEFFTARKSSPSEILVFLLILCIGIPFLLLLLEKAASILGNRARKFTHVLILFLLIASMALASMRSTPLPGSSIVLLVSLLTIGVIAGYDRFPSMATFFRFLAPSIAVIPALFLMNPAISNLLSGKLDVTLGPVIHSKTPVVLLIFDELPITSLLDQSGNIDARNYPNFARLANKSTWFRNATTASDSTPPSITAIQKGIYPTRKEIMRAPSLFTILSRSYELKVVESVTNNCPTQIIGEDATKQSAWRRMSFLMLDVSAIFLNIIVPHDFEGRIPSLNSTWGNFWGEQTRGNQIRKYVSGAKMEAFEPFLQSIHPPTERPTLYYLHMMLPHGPYEYFPSGRRYDHHFGKFSPSVVDGVDAAGSWKNNPWAVIQGLQRLLLQVGFTDKVLGLILDRLVETHVYDQALIIVMSDHGVSFHAGASRRDVTEGNEDEIARIVLMMKIPQQQKGAINDRNVETIDILPTILDVLEVKESFDLEGISMVNDQLPDRDQKRIYTRPRRTAGRYLHFHSKPLVENTLLQQRMSLFGEPFRFESVFQIGDHKELLNQTLKQTNPPQRTDIAVELHNPDVFNDVDPNAEMVPAFITGLLRFPEDFSGRLTLLIAVNDVIRATTKSFPIEPGLHGFGALVPEDSFHAGKNNVKVVVLE